MSDLLLPERFGGDRSSHRHTVDGARFLSGLVVENADHLVVASAPGGVDDNAGMPSPTEDPERDHERASGSSPNRVMVGTPCPEIPSPLNTLRTVPNRMRISSHSDQLSAYQTSRTNLSSQARALRPLIWARPVMPGLTLWRRICSGV